MWRTFLRVPLLLLLASLGGCAVYDYDYDDGDWRRYRGQPYAYEVPRYRVYDDGWRSERRYYSTRYYPAPRRYDGHRDYRREQYRYPQRHHESRPAHRGERHPGNWQRGGQPQWRGHSPQRWQQHGGQDRPRHRGQQGGRLAGATEVRKQRRRLRAPSCFPVESADPLGAFARHTLPTSKRGGSPMSHFLSFAKGALAMFWLVALVNLAYPLGELHRPILLLSGLLVLVHAAEILLLNGRLKARPAPWLERLQVLLFGVLHLRSLG